jgi:hypothetical protein
MVGPPVQELKGGFFDVPSRMSHASIDAKTRAERELPEDIIRLCVGIEEYLPKSFCVGSFPIS